MKANRKDADAAGCNDLAQWMKARGRGSAFLDGSVGGPDLRQVRRDQLSPEPDDKPCLFNGEDDDDWPPKDKKNHGRRQHRPRSR